MNQLLGGKKTNNSSSSGGFNVAGLAGQFLGGKKPSGGSHNSGGNSALTGIAGSLVGSFMGSGKKPEANSYSGQQPQQHQQGGFMGGVGSMFGGHQQQAC